MSFRFEDLEIWQEARKFIGKIYKITSEFPEKEKFDLMSQLRRAAISIALNIAEGSDRKSDCEFKRFLRTSLTSLEEAVTALYIALDQNCIMKNKLEEL